MGQVGTSVPSSKRVAKKARPQPKMKEAPQTTGLLWFQRHPHREGTGGGVLRGYGYRQREPEGYRAASEYVVPEALAVSLDEPLEWAVGFLFGNVELSLEPWTVISGILGFDD